MAGRPVAPGRQEEEAKDHGLKLSAARPLGHLPSIDETRPAGLGPASRRGSVLGPVLSFSRRNSLAGPSAGPGGRRPSLGPVPTLIPGSLWGTLSHGGPGSALAVSAGLPRPPRHSSPVPPAATLHVATKLALP